VKSRIFMISVDEVAQHFVFAERFRSGYTRSVTMSDGSIRTVRLTPAVHEDRDLVQLNDTGHVSYMGPHGTTTNGKLMVQVRAFDLLYPDGKSCAAAILSVPTVQAVYESLGTRPEIIRGRLEKLQAKDDEPELDHILMEDSFSNTLPHSRQVPQELRLLCGLVMHGSVELKEALTPIGAKPGGVPFFVAHHRRESELQSLWPARDRQTGRVLLLDDPFTSMRTVTDALEVSFGMDPASANRKMREVNDSGACILELSSGEDVTIACLRLNASWRSIGIPLYCAPESAGSDEHAGCPARLPRDESRTLATSGVQSSSKQPQTGSRLA
jgi:ATP-dependent Clp protease adapter protein ClpS